MRASVAIISHNYGRFLREAIGSVLTQTLKPVEVLVIDDGSTDDTAQVAGEYAARGVRYVRVDTGNVWINRLRAFEELQADWILCLDADNKLPSAYLEAAVAVGEADPRCGIVYPSLVRFGDENDLTDFERPTVPVSVANHVDAAAVYRREAVLQAGFRELQPDNDTAEDWMLARWILANGWTEAHNPKPVFYRVHGDNKHAGTTGRDYYIDAGLEFEPITIVVPLAGRVALWPMLADWLDRQTWPREQCRLVLVDNSHNESFGRTVRDWVAGCDYHDVRQYRASVGRAGMADEQRTGRPDHDRNVHRTVAGIYNRAIGDASTDYVLTLEDDIEAPADVVERLLRAMRPKVAAATAAYRHRNGLHWLAWHGEANGHNYATEKGHGVERIDGTGFGCLLLRKLVADSIRLTTEGPTPFFDANAFGAIAGLGWEVAIDWDAECTHHAGAL